MSVVVGCDRSEAAAGALRWAHRTASELGVDLHVVQAWSYPATAGLPFGRSDLPSPGEVDRRVEEELEQWVSDALGESAVGVTCVAVRGQAATGLVEYAQNHDSELLVVARRGLGALDRLLMGSTSRRCVDLSTVPVAVVPSTVSTDGPWSGPLVVGLDGSPGSTAALEWAAGVAERTEHEIVGVHGAFLISADYRPEFSEMLLQGARESLEEWTAPLAERQVSFTTRSADGDPRLFLTEVAEEVGASVLVVGAKGKSALHRIAVGSVASYVVARAPVPVVVVPGPRNQE
jgi:nucleotide-binding universal stress UspA family protein